MKGKRLLRLVLTTLLIATMFVSSMGIDPVVARSAASSPGLDRSVRPVKDENAIEGLLGGIAVPDAAAQLFNGIYTRHGIEIGRILSDNPRMVWDTLDLLLDLLPALRALPATGGRLTVNSGDYDRAAALLQRFTALSSSGLARDLGRTREWIDRRVTQGDAGKLVIDLN